MHITTQTDVVLSNKSHGCQKIYHVTIIEMVHENSKDVQRRIDDNRKTMGDSLHPYVRNLTAERCLVIRYI
jgi:hypothetical protein